MSIALVAASLFQVAPAPAAETSRTTTIAWGSCASDTKFPVQPIWSVLAAAKPDAVVLLGDTPYIDSTDLDRQIARRTTFFERADVKALRAIAPFHCTWDDHDFGTNDVDGRIAGKENSRAAFIQFQTGGPFGENDQGIYHAFRTGPIEVFLLDTRWFARTEDAEGSPGEPTLLGQAQWKWLESSLRASTAPFKVLACGMIWNDAVRPGKTDHWGAYRHERERLFRFLGANSIQGAVLVGGDIHRSRVVRHPTREIVGYEITELITSPMAQSVIATADVLDPGLVWDIGVEQTALVTSVIEKDGEPVLTARFVDEKGANLFTTRLAASHLRGSADGGARTPVGTFTALAKVEGSNALPATVYRPHGFTTERTWPALLFLHGMGESGTDNAKQLAVGLAPELRAHPERWPFVVLFPQKPRVEDEWEDHEAKLVALLDAAVRDHAVDPTRIAITGLSQGGHGTWEIARRHADRFVAVAPICGYPAPPAHGWGNFDRKRDWTIEMARASAATLAQTLRAKPVWTAHGEKDPIVPVEFTDVVVEAFGELGVKPTYQRLAGVSHDVWVRAYGEPALSTWFRDQLGVR